MMKKPAAALVALGFVFASIAYSQADAKRIESEIAARTSISAAFQLSSVLSAFMMDEPYFPYLFNGLCLAQNAGSLFADPQRHLPDLGAQFALDGLLFGNLEVAKIDELSPLLFNLSHKFSMYWTYDAYSSQREELSGQIHDAYRKYSLAELAKSPFELDNYKDWRVWGYIGSFAAFQVISLLTTSQESAIWTTGKSFIANREFPLYVGIPLIILLQVPNFCATGIGEESLYRGVYYEEMKRNLGLWPSKVLDGLYFTLSHLPQKIAMKDGIDIKKEIAGSLLSIGQTMWLQYIYDNGGLKPAIAAHTASDVIVFFLDWMLQAGNPNSAGFSINNRELSITFRM